MTVEMIPTKVRYVGNGVTTSFPTRFVFEEEEHVRVIMSRPVNSSLHDYTHTPLIQDKDYRLLGKGSVTGGTVVYPLAGTPLATGEVLHILSNIPITQEKIWGNIEAIDTREIEKANDKLTRICQQLAEAVSRCIQWPVTYSGDDDPTRFIDNLSRTEENILQVQARILEKEEYISDCLSSVLEAKSDVVQMRQDVVDGTAIPEFATAQEVQTGGVEKKIVTPSGLKAAGIVSPRGQFKNKVLNPNFLVNQRVFHGDLSGLSSGQYGFDMWGKVGTGSPVLRQVLVAENFFPGVYTLSWAENVQGASTTVRINNKAIANGGQVNIDSARSVFLDIVISTATVTPPISNIQLEFGPAKTNFEERAFVQELVLCQRFYCKSYSYDKRPGISSYAGAIINDSVNSFFNYAFIRFPVSMYKKPIITPYCPYTGTKDAVLIGGAGGSTEAASFYVTEISETGAARFRLQNMMNPGRFYMQYTAEACPDLT